MTWLRPESVHRVRCGHGAAVRCTGPAENSAILLQIATKSQKKHIRCEICGACPMACCGLLWPVMACYGLLWPAMLSRSLHMFSLSACCPVRSQDSPGYRDPTLNLFLNLTSELLTKPTLLAILRNLARSYAELLLEFCWNFGALYTQSLHDTLYTLYITWYPLYLRNSLG